jgi:prephenate dehydrogenase
LVFFPRVTILGVGLMGASFALALKKHNLCGHITGSGRTQDNLTRAKDRGILDSFDLDPSRAVADADLILFSMPVGYFLSAARGIRDSVKQGAVVTDVGSVKGRLVYEMEDIFSTKAFFIGAHPIAGSERSGIEISNRELFQENRCVLTPTDRTDPRALNNMEALWKTLGAEVVTMSPEEHDRIFGAVSHLPHLIAYEMVNTVDEINGSYFMYAGKGFLDSTRIASSSPELWKDICIFNRENLTQFMDILMGRLERIRKHIAEADGEALEREFRKAKSLRDGCGQR